MRLPINLVLENLELTTVLLNLDRKIFHKEIEEMSMEDIFDSENKAKSEKVKDFLKFLKKGSYSI